MSRLYFQESLAEAKAVIQRLLDDDVDALDPRAHLERLIPNQCPECKSTNVTDADDEGLIDCMDCGIWFEPLHPNNAPGSEFYGKSAPRTESLDDEDALDPASYAQSTVNIENMAHELGFRYEGVNNSDPKDKRTIWSKQLDPDVQMRVVVADDPTRVNIFFYRCVDGKITWKGIGAQQHSVPVNKVREIVQHWDTFKERFQESIDDEIPDLKAYAMQRGLPPRITISFNRTTPESSENGEFSESGWTDEDGVEMTPDKWDQEEGLTVVDKAVEFLWKEGATQHSSSSFDEDGWYSTGWQTKNYGTGEDEECNYHLEDFTQEQKRQIYDNLMAKIAARRNELTAYLNRERERQ